ncbi:MAG: glycosyltransferase [Lachnospiraceae bacterium]|nr:glycosyltransferase [Lachnospiraceae bacterium]
MATIDILMATFNGAKYISTQMDSIISQSFTDWRLIIHDDGSNDNTIDIIHNYLSKDSRIILIDDGIKGLGPGQNFWHLHKYINAPFICYCDQDDYWFPDNLQKKYEIISKMDNSLPQVVCFNGYTWYSDDNNRIENLWSLKNPNYSFRSILFNNGGVQGCSLIMNSMLISKIRFPLEKVWLHDQIIAFYAMCFNCLHFSDYPLMLYRQHKLNVSGHLIRKPRDLFSITRIFSEIPVVDRRSYEAIISFHILCKDIISEKDQKLFDIFKKFPEIPLYKRVCLTMRYRFSLNGSCIKLIIKQICRKFIS